MGSFLSYPLCKDPYTFGPLEPKDSRDESEEEDFSSQLHQVNLRFCKNMVQQRIRSRNEQAKFYEHGQNWSEITKVKEKYPQWTSQDLMNLRHQFYVFDRDGDHLLHFSELNEALDFIQHDSSPEQRRVMFETVDVHQYNAINFEEYLQLMNNIKIGTPVHRPPETETDKDPAIMDIICDVAKADQFTQQCYSFL